MSGDCADSHMALNTANAKTLCMDWQSITRNYRDGNAQPSLLKL